MAEMALGILGPAIEVVKCVGPTIKRQFSYLCCFTCNVATLRDEAKNLDYEAGKLQDRVDADKNDEREDIHEIVETWLTDSGDITRTKERILAEATEVGLGSGCFNYAKRVSLSKEAMKTAEDIKELIRKCKFDSISRSLPIAATSAVPFGKVIYEFRSRKRFEEDIMTSLHKDKNVDKVGIWGTGGVGKTILAQKILNRALKEGLFDEVVMVSVGQPVDKLYIQLKIAELLSLKLDAETLKPRADKLRVRLMQKKRTLILLDDVWEVVNVEELGIPCDGEWCTIILTSRDKDVLKGMKVKNVCELGFLDEDEAWDFFKKMAGTCVDDAILKPTAYDVMKECKGLLVALETVGKAHEAENRQDVWTDSLQQLRKHNPVDIPNVIKEVYRPLKLSYDRLESENAKSIILLCCLFAEDADIPLEHLTYFAMGSRLFDGIWELEQVRGRIRRSIDTLRNRCLLLDGSDEDHVRMHDVVRDVSIYIASEERRIKCSDCTWISSHVDRGSRPQSCFPQLKLLLMNNKVEQDMKINIGNLIGESTELNVLFIDYGLMKSLPLHTLQSLKTNLTTFVLLNCGSLKSIAVVGELENLEILICHSCRSIKELPEQVRGLKRLKLLEISECLNLERVAAEVISNLVGLEELKIVRSFDKWKGWEFDEGKEATTDTSLREIESLKQLRCLNIQVSDIALAAQPLRLSSKLVQFTVQFGEYYYSFDDDLSTQSYQRKMSLDFGRGNDANWGDLSTNIYLTCTECLYASGNGQDFKLNLAIAQRIRWLSLRDFTNKKNITSTAAAFPLLDFLNLRNLFNLEEIWDDAPVPSDSFNNLKHLKLDSLRALKRMGKSVLSTTNDFFFQLETIEIVYCDEMEHLLVLVPNEEEKEQDKEDDINTTLIFPKLKTLTLYDVPKLRNMICSSSIGIASIQFPLLAQMEIGACKKLKFLISRDDEEEEDNHHYYQDDDSLHLFCNPKVSFPNLKALYLDGNMESKHVWCDKVPIDFFKGLQELEISFYSKIRRLFSSSSKVPQNLVNLQKLAIERCWEMVKVIEDDEEVSSSCHHPTIHTPLLVFPSLQEIDLRYLRKLESFCEWGCALEFPALKILRIDDCLEMKSFNAAGSLVITPSLQTIRINRQDLECVDDLNAAVHQQFEEAKIKGFVNKMFVRWHRLLHEINFMKVFVERGDRMHSINKGMCVVLYTGLKPWKCAEEERDCNRDLAEFHWYASNSAHRMWWRVYGAMPENLRPYCLRNGYTTQPRILATSA